MQYYKLVYITRTDKKGSFSHYSFKKLKQGDLPDVQAHLNAQRKDQQYVYTKEQAMTEAARLNGGIKS